MMQRELWRNRWLGSINELTSLNLQRESWLDETNSNPHWSFVEFICSYFDDLVIDDNYKEILKSGWISQDEFEVIKTWHELLDNYDSPQEEDYNHKSIIEDKAWQLIIDEGKHAIKQLIKSLNKQEIQILTEEIDYSNLK